MAPVLTLAAAAGRVSAAAAAAAAAAASILLVVGKDGEWDGWEKEEEKTADKERSLSPSLSSLFLGRGFDGGVTPSLSLPSPPIPPPPLSPCTLSCVCTYEA